MVLVVKTRYICCMHTSLRPASLGSISRGWQRHINYTQTILCLFEEERGFGTSVQRAVLRTRRREGVDTTATCTASVLRPFPVMRCVQSLLQARRLCSFFSFCLCSVLFFFFFPEVLVPDLCARCCTRLPCRTCFIAPAHLSSCVCVPVIWLRPAGVQVLPQPAAPSLVFACTCVLVCVHLPGVSLCNLAVLCAVIKGQLPPHFSATWLGTKAAPGHRD